MAKRSLIRSVFIAVGLAFFNLAIGLGLFIAVVSVIASILAVGVSGLIAGLGIILAGLMGLFGVDLHFAIHTTSVIQFLQGYMSLAFIGVGLSAFSFGGLFTLAGVWLSERFMTLSMRYLRWQVRLITGDPKMPYEQEVQLS